MLNPNCGLEVELRSDLSGSWRGTLEERVVVLGGLLWVGFILWVPFGWWWNGFGLGGWALGGLWSVWGEVDDWWVLGGGEWLRAGCPGHGR